MKKIMLLILMLCSLAMTSGPALAVNISLVPSNQWIHPGDIASVDIVVSGLGNPTNPSLGAFSMDIGYDPTILSITDTDVGFGSFLGTPISFDLLDLSAAAYVYVDNSVPGLVHLDETSWLDISVLDTLQPDTFTLATLNFTGIGVGISPLDFIYVDLSDVFGFTIDPNTVTTTGASVSVPEPSTLLLLSTGIVGLTGIGRKKFIRRHE